MEFAKVPRGVKKAKKKPVKDELDRIKQAEKKKRRLEKALANSAAICSELEKKKQMKIEEQKRLDEEGAAIAEAVALNVLLDDDSGEQDKSLNYRNFLENEIKAIGRAPNVYRNWNNWGEDTDINTDKHTETFIDNLGGRMRTIYFLDPQHHIQELMAQICAQAHTNNYPWGKDTYIYTEKHPLTYTGHTSVLTGPFGQIVCMPCSDESSVDFTVAQAVASLQIAEGDHFGPRV